MTMLSIFEEPELKQISREPQTCDFCGEVSANGVVHMNNHGIIFNGWCIKAMMFHNRVHNNNPDEINWLVRHGIDPYRSKFEQSA
jgi:hypothetical protein